MLHTGIAWQHLPGELGFGSGVTCWRRLDEWQRAGVWQELGSVLLRSPPDRPWLRPRLLRWVVERTFAWLHNFKRLLIRYERRADMHNALLALGCCLVCFRRLGSSI